MTIYPWHNLSVSEQQQLLMRPAHQDKPVLQQSVQAIIEQVQLTKDAGVYAATAQFDRVQLTHLVYTSEQIQQQLALLDPAVKQAIDQAYDMIYSFHQAQYPKPISVQTAPGINCQLAYRAIERVGLYIPGGSAPLPSTVLMLAIPAQIAGCEQLTLATPPNQQGHIHPAIVYAAQRCGIKQIVTVGGVQAIATFAYGTESIPAVDKIFGPGNAYVTLAKQLVAQQTLVAIDMPAGPSEVLVLADAQANAEYVAADLLSQAEHGPDSQVILVTPSHQFAEQVIQETAIQLQQLPRQSIAQQSLQHARFIVTSSLEQAVEVSNTYAPEHLIIQVEQPETLLPLIRHAASIFVGPYSPESVGDYASGTNHVLPTYGYSRMYNSLGVLDFMVRYTIQQLSASGLEHIADSVIALAQAEGLHAHAHAVAIRRSTLQKSSS